MPHDLFLQWPVNYKHASFCRQTQGKAEIPRHLMFWQLDKRITVIFKLTVLQSYFTHFLVLLAPALLELLLHLFSRALSCSLFRCSSLLYYFASFLELFVVHSPVARQYSSRLFTRALSCSFPRCLSLILCLFARALSCSFSLCLSLIHSQRINKTDFESEEWSSQ